MTFHHTRTVPVLRSFDENKAKGFYVGFLGFRIDWEHRFEPGTPLYMQVSRGGVVFHISEHHGDGSPGVHVRVELAGGLRAYHAEISAKGYPNMRPGLDRPDWGGLEMKVIDPVNNRIIFAEPAPLAPAGAGL